MADRIKPEQPQPAASVTPSTPSSGDKTMAVLALVFAIVMPLVGLILAIVVRKRYPEGVEGHGLVKAALIVSIVLLALSLLIVLLIFGLFAAVATAGMA